MGAKADTITALSAAVRVNALTGDGKQQLQQAGWGPDAKPILEPRTKIVFLSRGDTLPDNVADGEAERLKADGAIGTAEQAAAFGTGRSAPPEPAAPEAAAPPELANLAAADDAQLAALYESNPPKVTDLLAAVGDDPALAARVLAAENTATNDDPRKTLAEGLQKIIDGGSGE
jgi:hypothetical protein